MRAVVLREYDVPLQVEEVQLPKPEPHEALIKVKACGLCGTDLKIWKGELPQIRLPVIMGHEPTGEVVEVGSEVSHLSVGDRVVAHFYVTCGRCEFCRSGRETICCNMAGQVGFAIDGGFAEYMKLPALNFIKLSKSIPFEEAAILGDAVATSYHAVVSRARIIPGQTVLVMGVGGVGIHTVQVARAAGARVIAVDVNDRKLEMAMEYGADETIGYSPSDFTGRVKELTDGEGVHAVFETVGSPETLVANLQNLRPGGKLVIIGYKPGRMFPVDPLNTLLGEKEILGSRAATKEELKAVVRLVEANKIKPVVTREFGLDEINYAFEELREDRILARAVVIPK